jgi:hypothetical protein
MARKTIIEPDTLDPVVEEEYWRSTYQTRSYVDPSAPYDDYGPAYQYGWEASNRYGERNWDAIEEDMQRNWDRGRGGSKLTWEKAKDAIRDAWERVTEAVGAGEDKRR